MNNQKADAKPPDHDEGDHAQPINLVSPRPPTPASAVITAFSGLTAPTANQPVALRPHGETPKPGPGLMTLYFRAPTTRPSGPGHIVSPLMGAQVASAQHFGNKQALKGIKGMRVGYYPDKLTDKTGGEFNIKVIRVPSNDNGQSQSNSATTTTPTITPGILPNALAGNSNRHIIPAAVHSGISPGASGSMASIIKGHQVSQVSHTIHQSFSSHVPRGPAAVANISAGPRSGVATPIVRAPHSSGTMTLASSMISPNAHVRVRSQTLTTGRTPVASTAAYAQVIDLQKNSIGHSLSSNPTQIGSSARSLDIGSSIRSGVTHPQSITISKPISISQPIVQHLQQVPEKNCSKTGLTSTTTSTNSTPAHQNSTILTGGHAASGEVHSVCIVPTRSTGSTGAYTTGIVQFPTTAIQQHVPALRPSLVQPQSTNLSAGQGNQAFAVISAKSLPQGNQSVTLAPPLNRTSIATTSAVQPCGSVVTTMTSARVLNTSSPGATIPISNLMAKVYPQTGSATQVSNLQSAIESARSSPFVGQSGTLSTLKPVTTITSGAATTIVTTVASNVHNPAVIKRSDSTASVRFAPLNKQQIPSGTSFAVPSGSYIYDQCPSSLSVHPYSISTSNQGFSATIPSSQLQTFALSQHGNSNVAVSAHSSAGASTGSASSVQPLNSLMVAVDSRQVSTQYNRVTIGTAKRMSEVVTHAPTVVTTHTSNSSASLVTLAQAPAAQNHNQANTQNHLSPRPSILRKRPHTECVPSMAKRNLISSLCSADPGSPGSDFNASLNSSSSASPKPTNGQMRDNDVMPLSGDIENRILLPGPMTAIKKEPVISDENFNANDESRNFRQVEASPRKKPRKQLLAANEMMETHSSDGEEQLETKPNVKDLKTEEDNVHWVTFRKKPAMSLLTTYRHGWKSRHNHFSRYSDVKPKEEKHQSVADLANSKSISEEVHGWKVHHLTGQMDDLAASEDSVHSRLVHWLELEKKNSVTLSNMSATQEDMKIVNKLTDLVKGNLQRSKLSQEQAFESKSQIIKLFDHKNHIMDIFTKYASRRQAKKKDKS